jgi:hypothetical protein
MHDCARAVGDEQLGDDIAIADISLEKPIAPVGRGDRQIRRIPSVGQLIQIDDV